MFYTNSDATFPVQEKVSGSSMNLLPLFHVDAFASRPFTGNPAAVCLLEDARDSAWMQSLAAELNLADTAFLLPMADRLQLRWFTPKTEVDLCGHATLAAAHVLKELAKAGEIPKSVFAVLEEWVHSVSNSKRSSVGGVIVRRHNAGLSSDRCGSGGDSSHAFRVTGCL
jgi:hypothetical protein